MRHRPLADTQFELLMLVVRERTGKEIAEAYRIAHRREISLGTLYTTLRRMHAAGLVEITREKSDEDGRYRYYQLTGNGARALRRDADLRRDRALAALDRLGSVP